MRHAIWSTLEDTRTWVPLDDNRMPTLHGRYKVPHFDSKGEADQFFRDAGVPTTFLLTSFYWDNFIFFGLGPKPGPDGVLAITLPMDDRKLPGIAAGDIGACALGVLRRPDLIGKTVGIAGEHLTGGEMAAAMTRALGQTVRYNAVPPEVYRGFGFPGADDLGNMFQFKRDFNDYYCGARDPGFSRSLHPQLQTFDAWLAAHKAQIPPVGPPPLSGASRPNKAVNIAAAEQPHRLRAELARIIPPSFGHGARPGTRIGSYEILSAIGAGGMGEVYLAATRSSNATSR